ncbi:unnamed protein product [Phytomonas sp. Hart1]|nr:unnamed protein product [Phytomonas sp. Hart1]|eukprot:CCW68427.1 unnamed protein product [Phytomonas sp. isolate Hart1]
MSYNSTIIFRHVPLIRFTYAISKSAVVVPKTTPLPEVPKTVPTNEAVKPVAKITTEKTPQTTQVVYNSFNDLPQNLQPKIISEDIIEKITMGGADPYTPKHLQKKK